MSNPAQGVAGNPESQPTETGQPKALLSGLQKLSDEKPHAIQEMMMALGVGPAAHPLHQKMTPEHITQVLTLAAKHDERQFEIAKQSESNESSHKTSTRRYFFWCFAIVMGIAILMLFLYQDKPNVLLPALTGLGGFITGVAGGFGLGRQKAL